MHAAAERLRRCAELLGAELDQPRPDRRFLRRAVGLAAAAALAAGGLARDVVANEVADHIELHAPISLVDEGARKVERLDASLDLAPADQTWSVVDGDLGRWRTLLPCVDEADQLVYDVSRFDAGLTITFDFQTVDGPLASLTVRLDNENAGPDDGLAQEALLWSLDETVPDKDTDASVLLALDLLRHA